MASSAAHRLDVRRQGVVLGPAGQIAGMAGVQQHQHLAALAQPLQGALELADLDPGVGDRDRVVGLGVGRQQVVAAVGLGAVAGEVDHGHVLLPRLHVPLQRAQAGEHRPARGLAVGQVLDVDLGVQPALLAEQGGGDIPRVVVGEVELEPGRVGVVADADREHVQLRSRRRRAVGQRLHRRAVVGDLGDAQRAGGVHLPQHEGQGALSATFLLSH
jgi:hypothetical protein